MQPSGQSLSCGVSLASEPLRSSLFRSKGPTQLKSTSNATIPTVPTPLARQCNGTKHTRENPAFPSQTPAGLPIMPYLFVAAHKTAGSQASESFSQRENKHWRVGTLTINAAPVSVLAKHFPKRSEQNTQFTLFSQSNIKVPLRTADARNRFHHHSAKTGVH